MSKIIAFGHRRRVGKDSAVQLLVQRYPQTVEARSFAEPLYDICHTLYGWAGFLTKVDYDGVYGHLKEKVLPEIGKSPRQILIDMGTKAIRQNVYDGTWVEYALRTCNPDKLTLFSDLRFPNEFKRVKDLGGWCVRIDRHGAPVSDDIADSALDSFSDWDDVIVNNGTLEDLFINANYSVTQYMEQYVTKA